MILLAGPNGAGKTTASTYLLRDALHVGEFVNADMIASGLSALAPESVAFQAGRILLRRVRGLLNDGVDFAFETTLSSRSLANVLREATAAGYDIDLIYLALPSSTIAIRRVATRVQTGGHNIPTHVIERRFYRSLANLFHLYMPLVTRWKVLDNHERPPVPIAAGSRKRRTIFSEQKWKHLIEISEVRQND